MMGNFNSNQRNNFISQVLSNYSDIIFVAYNTLKEIRELDMVKYALHFKYKKLRKLNTDLEAEIEDLKRFGETNKTIKDILIRQKCDVEIKYNDSISQLIVYKEEINVINFFNNQTVTNKLLTLSDKYSKIEIEHETIKKKLIKEFKILKSQYDIAVMERDTVREALFEFKRYFSRFTISDEGDIIYINELK